MQRDPFFHTKPYIRTSESFSGAGVGINLSGSDWLGLGEIFGSASQGTAMCGAKPNCIPTGETSSCFIKQRNFEACVARSLEVAELQVGAQIQQNKTASELEAKKRMTKIVVVSVISLALVVTTFLIIRSYRK